MLAVDNDYEKWLPSASIKFDLTPRDRITASVARTNRRPDFNYISPALLEEEVGDSDLLGNLFLAPEMSWGVDLGSERRIGRTAVAAIQFFYSDITNPLEMVNTRHKGSDR